MTKRKYLKQIKNRIFRIRYFWLFPNNTSFSNETKDEFK